MPRSTLNRMLRIASAAIYCLAFGSISWLLVTRWNGVPATPGVLLDPSLMPDVPIDPEQDRTRQLHVALAAIPALPLLEAPPPPPGKEWDPASLWSSIEVRDALNGPWTPEERPNLRGVIEFVTSPAVENALDGIAAIPPGGWRPERDFGISISVMHQMRDAASISAARCRTLHSSSADVDAALAALLPAYRIAEIGLDGGTALPFMSALACESIAHWELMHMGREIALTRDQVTTIVSFINEHSASVDVLHQAAIGCIVSEAEAIIDATYTNDRNGDGWLVLSRLGTMSQFPTSRTRCGAWNVLSPLFNTRRTVQAKLTVLRRTASAAQLMSHADGQAMLSQAVQFNFFDGPLATIEPNLFLENQNRFVARVVAERGAAIIAAALSAHRREHGEFPASLSALTPEYLETLPDDPFGRGTLQYRLTGPDEYVLYSVGSNGVDDGGVMPSNDNDYRTDENDFLLSRKRNEPSFEPRIREDGND